MDPSTLRYAESHEWASLEGNICTVGLSQFAVDQLTDIVYLELPASGKSFQVGQECGEVESVKSVNPIYSPVDGEVVEVNTKAAEDAALVGEDPLGKGWLFKVKMAEGATLDHLKSWDEYQKQIESENH